MIIIIMSLLLSSGLACRPLRDVVYVVHIHIPTYMQKLYIDYATVMSDMLAFLGVFFIKNLMKLIFFLGYLLYSADINLFIIQNDLYFIGPVLIYIKCIDNIKESCRHRSTV